MMEGRMITVATFNVNSIRTRLSIVISWIKKYQPDILCLQETKCQDKHFPLEAFVNIGYHAVFKGEKSYNGVAIVSKDKIEDVHFGMPGIDPEDQPDESRIIRARIGNLHIINTYVPQGRSVDAPQFAYKLRWFKRLKKCLEENYSPSDSLLWMGDLNIAPEEKDVHDPVKLLGHVCYHPEVHSELQKVMSWGFVDIFRQHRTAPGEYTFFDYRVPNSVKRGIGWRIDHIMGTRSMAHRSYDAFVDMRPRLMEKPSDHTPLVAKFKM